MLGQLQQVKSISCMGRGWGARRQRSSPQHRQTRTDHRQLVYKGRDAVGTHKLKVDHFYINKYSKMAAPLLSHAELIVIIKLLHE